MPQIFQRKNGEILVNTVTAGTQSAQHIAALPGGGFVLVWSDTSGVGGDTPDSGIKGQRFDADGNKVGGEFLVNTAIDGFQGQAEVAALDNGRFVVTWTSEIGPEGDDPGSGIKGQVFNADGTKSGGEFFANTSMPDLQLSPTVTALANGGFVISWTDFSGLGGDPDLSIKMQIFSSSGTPVGGELLVNTVTGGDQNGPAIAALASGGFAVVWAVGTKIEFQRFDDSGGKIGSELQVNTVAGGTSADIAALGSGFVVTWSHRVGLGDSNIRAQLLDANGAKIGGEIEVNTITAGDQRLARVAQLPDGSFLVTWEGPSAGGAGQDIHGQVFTAAGAKVGVEFVVNGVTADAQTVPEIAVLASGDIVATWTDASGTGGDAAPNAVKLQILTLAGPPTDIALSDSSLSETAIDNIEVATLSATGAINSGFTYTIVSDSAGGAFAVDGDKLVVADNRLLDFETQPSVEVRIRATDLNGNSYEETMTLAVTDAAIEQRWSAGNAFPVNTDTVGFNTPAAVTDLASGGFVVISSWFNPGFGSGQRGQIFDSAGGKVGAEFDLDVGDRSGGRFAAAPLPSGGFILVFEGIATGGGGTFPIRAQRFDSAGNEVGAELTVSTNNGPILQLPSVAALDSGNLVVTWTILEDEAGGAGSQIAAQLLDPAGTKLGGEFRVNTGTAGGQTNSHVAALPGGGFVVTWEDLDGEGVEGQIFDGGGNKVGGELPIYASASEIGQPEVAALEAGGFVVTWTELVTDGVVGIGGQVVGADGVNVGGPLLLAVAVTGGAVIEQHVAGLPGGGFVLSWSDSTPAADDDEDYTDSWAQFFSATGAPVGDPFLVAAGDGNSQRAAQIDVLGSGDVVFAWDYEFVENGSAVTDMSARILSRVDGSGDIVGTPGQDILVGTGGDDHILGLGGDDYLVGGGGNDNMEGGLGNDSYYVDSGGDMVSEAVGRGQDIVYASVSYQLVAGTEIEFLSAGSQSATTPLTLVGNAFGQFLYGNAGANYLDGGSGNDTLVGFGGDDSYVVDDVNDYVAEVAGGGNDVVYVRGSFSLGADQEVEILAALSQAGTAPIVIVGNNFNQIMFGNAGANYLDGGGGNDTLVGFGGDDSYLVDDVNDYVAEVAGGGSDIVYVRGSFSLGADQEVETLAALSQAGTAPIVIVGNGIDQRLFGNNGDNYLDGGGGTDILQGFSGNDTYVVDSLGDYVVEGAGQGNDVVYARSSYALVAGQEIEVLAAISSGGTAAIDLTGNEFGNALYGNNGANILNGGAGGDYLQGFGGADSFAFTTALGGGNVDAIADFVSGTDKVLLDDAVFTGLGLGALNANAFVTGSQAGDADDRIVYNSATGQLFFDADGNGAGAAILFATLDGHPPLNAGDFTVI